MACLHPDTSIGENKDRPEIQKAPTFLLTNRSGPEYNMTCADSWHLYEIHGDWLRF